MPEPGTPAFIAQYSFERAIRAGTTYGGPGSPRITGQQLWHALQTNIPEYTRLKSLEAAQEIYQGNPGAGPHYALSAKAQKDREEAERYARISAGFYNPSIPTSPQKPGTPPPIIQMQQARDTRTGSWSTRVQTYTYYLQGTQPSLNPIYARDQAIAYIGPDPAAVPVIKAGPYKSQLQLDEEARVAKQARDLETARQDSVGKAVAAAKNPTAASVAAYAQRIAAFGNAPAVPPPVPKPAYVRDYKETIDYLTSVAVAAVQKAIANGAVLASVVAKAPPKKNQPKKTKGSKSGLKGPVSKLNK